MIGGLIGGLIVGLVGGPIRVPRLTRQHAPCIGWGGARRPVKEHPRSEEGMGGKDAPSRTVRGLRRKASAAAVLGGG
jgi:hypothetical protein